MRALAMRALIVGDTLHNPAVEQAASRAGIEVEFLSSRWEPNGDADKQIYDVLLAGADHGDHRSLAGSPLLSCAKWVIPLSGENITANISTLPRNELERLGAYFAYGGPENLYTAFQRLRQLTGDTPETPLSPPRKVALDAVFTLSGADRTYPSAAAFFQCEGRSFPRYVGLLCYRGRWSDGDLDVERAIAERLARRNIGVIPAYTDGSPDRDLGTLPFEEAVERFFCMEGRPVIELLINFQFFGARAAQGEDMFQRAADCFAALDIPVVRPVGLGTRSIAEWRNSYTPYAAELPTNFILPEMQGIVEPVHISCAGGTRRQRVPIPDRVERLTARIANWVALREIPNGEKRVAIMLHNAPCAGVEATVGQATDLDAFQSTVDILRCLQAEGYAVKNIPENGSALREKIYARKAFSDFRWTSAEEIAARGGVLYAMPAGEYASYYEKLVPEDAKKEMVRNWGLPPGEAMVLSGHLLITGIRFGNVVVMVQPKRGCYGAKCTGEVCKILQDPACPPTHQFLATYWYLQHHWKANAVIHLGTHGALEFLPGKNCGLSGSCFPDIAVGELVNLYPYNAATVPQALIARRRSYAVTISYLPAPGKGLDAGERQLSARIRAYFDAKDQESRQADRLRQQIDAMRPESPALRAVLARELDFDAALRELQALLTKTDASRRAGSLRALGEIPNEDWVRDYLEEYRSGQSSPVPEEETEAIRTGLAAAGEEMRALLHALAGGYLRPTQGGDALVGSAILPTGRNLRGAEQDRVPTPAAYAQGRQAAEELLSVYQKETGRLPEKIALNMTSIDVARTGGEQLGQFLALMGVRPVWTADDRVEQLVCIPLAELGRPRVDVTARISSVMRDAWPQTLVLMDRAVALAAAQEEPETQNFVRRNARAIAQTGEDGTGRVFGGKPGTYTSAVGLALKASAWKGEEDLAKYFIDGSSYLYGENRDGVRAPGAFAANVRQVEATGDVTSSRRTDAVASSYSARVQGGFALAAKALGSRRTVRQYMGEVASNGSIRVVPMAAHMAQAVEDTLLNDVWREQMMAQGPQGAAELMQRIQNVFEIQCTCDAVPAEMLDTIANRYLLEEEMSDWFRKTNPYALEEASRRFLELEQRGKWRGDPAVVQKLQRAYLAAEGDLEDGLCGEAQGGNVEVVTDSQVTAWAERLRETEEVMGQWKQSRA